LFPDGGKDHQFSPGGFKKNSTNTSGTNQNL
jgi:hypothetical protein